MIHLGLMPITALFAEPAGSYRSDPRLLRLSTWVLETPLTEEVQPDISGDCFQVMLRASPRSPLPPDISPIDSPICSNTMHFFISTSRARVPRRWLVSFCPCALVAACACGPDYSRP